MARNLSATEAVDLVYNDFSDDFSNSESEREGVQEVYSYYGGTTVEARKLDLLAKAVVLLPVKETTSFQFEGYY